MSPSFWMADWFEGLVFPLVLLLSTTSAFLQNFERKAYGLGVQASVQDDGDK
jgi:hypothetical protein